ncbi:MAG: endonuclease/exonuclease/phosphatase family protein [Prevotella sp.]|nr:endonuclease/exonuclease/phosphatase family protein [Prevotella sp.]
MKRRFLLLFTLTVVIMTACAQQLYVGSYNIRYQNDGDKRDGNGWTQRCPVLCNQVLFEHPDIFGAQEVLWSQIDDMLSQLQDYDYIGRGRDDGEHAGEHAAIFYDRQRLKLLDHGDFWLSETPEKPTLGWDAACIRICTWGKFRLRHSRRTFYFFNLHMDHVGKAARREGAKLVVQRIREIAKNKPVVLTGDFNVDQNDEIYHIFLDSDILDDTYEEAKVLFAENGTFNAFDPELRTFSRIDHVFVSTNFEVDRYGVLTNSYWMEGDESGEMKKAKNAPQEINFSRYVRRLPSDHYPVFVHLRF